MKYFCGAHQMPLSPLRLLFTPKNRKRMKNEVNP
jgi:hypothetical protein